MQNWIAIVDSSLLKDNTIISRNWFNNRKEYKALPYVKDNMTHPKLRLQPSYVLVKGCLWWSLERFLFASQNLSCTLHNSPPLSLDLYNAV